MHFGPCRGDGIIATTVADNLGPCLPHYHLGSGELRKCGGNRKRSTCQIGVEWLARDGTLKSPGATKLIGT
jgi:hypothetical protein